MTELNGFKIEKYNQYNLDLNQRYSTCPLCSHTRRKNPKQKCLTIFVDTGLAHCSHCGERVQLHTYKKKEQDIKYEKPKPVNNTDLPDSLVKYWAERGISQFTLRMMKVGYKREWMPGPNKELPAMFFPYYKNEELINIKFRAHYKEGEEKKRAFKLVKDAQKIPYNLDGIATDKECIILEGEPDCLSFIECGIRNVTSSPNGSTNKGNVNLTWLDENIEYFENKDFIYLGLDNDEAGQHVQKELIRRLGAEKIKIIDYGEFKDGNEVLVKKGKEAVLKLIEDAQMIPLEGVSTYSDVKSELEEFYRNGWKKGYTSGIRDLDEKFSTYTGQFVVVTGTPSCFTKKQTVLTSEGGKAISELKKGDHVLSYNEDLRINQYKKVLNTMINNFNKDKIYRITMRDGTVIECTENHRFYIGKSYVKIKDLLSLKKNK